MSDLSRPGGRNAALLIVDAQNEYIEENGPLSVPGAKEIIPVINQLCSKVGFELVVLSQESRPKGHVSFLSTHIRQGKDYKMKQTIILPNGESQKLWPDHSIEGSDEAEIHASLEASRDNIIRKGVNAEVDSGDAFLEGDGQSRTGLAQLLRKKNITDLYICGYSWDNCVGLTALKAIQLGFRTHLIKDAVRYREQQVQKEAELLMEAARVKLLVSSMLLDEKVSEGDRRQVADKYMNQRGIHRILKALCAELVFHQPDDPRAFMIERLEKMKDEGENSKKGLLSDEELGTLFTMLDPIEKGNLDKNQVVNALGGLHLAPAADIDQDALVDKDAFVKIVRDAQLAQR